MEDLIKNWKLYYSKRLDNSNLSGSEDDKDFGVNAKNVGNQLVGR